MNKITSARGRQKVRSIACYDDTWNEFRFIRKQYGMTSDQFLDYAMRELVRSKRANRKGTLDEIIKYLQDKRAELTNA